MSPANDPREADSPLEMVYVTSHRVMCDGSGGIRPAGQPPATALGHPRVWLEIDEKGYVDCGYCDKRFAYKGDPAAHGLHEAGPGDDYTSQPVEH
jgi:NADH dehydrogenase (ubiquinone) Fe-S protein 6